LAEPNQFLGQKITKKATKRRKGLAYTTERKCQGIFEKK
jgi:hypothetical protein